VLVLRHSKVNQDKGGWGNTENYSFHRHLDCILGNEQRRKSNLMNSQEEEFFILEESATIRL